MVKTKKTGKHQAIEEKVEKKSYGRPNPLGPKLKGEMPPLPEGEPPLVHVAYERVCYNWQLLIGPQDYENVLKYCRLWADYEVLWKESHAEGIMIEEEGKLARPNPKFRESLALWDKMFKVIRAIGATPTDRAKVPHKILSMKDMEEMTVEDLLT